VRKKKLLIGIIDGFIVEKEKTKEKEKIIDWNY
jgi:hypothetical protein